MLTSWFLLVYLLAFIALSTSASPSLVSRASAGPSNLSRRADLGRQNSPDPDRFLSEESRQNKRAHAEETRKRHRHFDKSNPGLTGLSVQDFVKQGQDNHQSTAAKLNKAAKSCWGAFCGRSRAKHDESAAQPGPSRHGSVDHQQAPTQQQPVHHSQRTRHESAAEEQPAHQPRPARQDSAQTLAARKESKLKSAGKKSTVTPTSEPNSRTHLLSWASGSKKTRTQSEDPDRSGASRHTPPGPDSSGGSHTGRPTTPQAIEAILDQKNGKSTSPKKQTRHSGESAGTSSSSGGSASKKQSLLSKLNLAKMPMQSGESKKPSEAAHQRTGLHEPLIPQPEAVPPKIRTKISSSRFGRGLRREPSILEESEHEVSTSKPNTPARSPFATRQKSRTSVSPKDAPPSSESSSRHHLSIKSISSHLSRQIFGSQKQADHAPTFGSPHGSGHPHEPVTRDNSMKTTGSIFEDFGPSRPHGPGTRDNSVKKSSSLFGSWGSRQSSVKAQTPELKHGAAPPVGKYVKPVARIGELLHGGIFKPRPSPEPPSPHKEHDLGKSSVWTATTESGRMSSHPSPTHSIRASEQGFEKPSARIAILENGKLLPHRLSSSSQRSSEHSTASSHAGHSGLGQATDRPHVGGGGGGLWSTTHSLTTGDSGLHSPHGLTTSEKAEWEKGRKNKQDWRDAAKENLEKPTGQHMPKETPKTKTAAPPTQYLPGGRVNLKSDLATAGSEASSSVRSELPLSTPVPLLPFHERFPALKLPQAIIGKPLGPVPASHRTPAGPVAEAPLRTDSGRSDPSSEASSKGSPKALPGLPPPPGQRQNLGAGQQFRKKPARSRQELAAGEPFNFKARVRHLFSSEPLGQD